MSEDGTPGRSLGEWLIAHGVQLKTRRRRSRTQTACGEPALGEEAGATPTAAAAAGDTQDTKRSRRASYGNMLCLADVAQMYSQQLLGSPSSGTWEAAATSAARAAAPAMHAQAPVGVSSGSLTGLLNPQLGRVIVSAGTPWAAEVAVEEFVRAAGYPAGSDSSQCIRVLMLDGSKPLPLGLWPGMQHAALPPASVGHSGGSDPPLPACTPGAPVCVVAKTHAASSAAPAAAAATPPALGLGMSTPGAPVSALLDQPPAQLGLPALLPAATIHQQCGEAPATAACPQPLLPPRRSPGSAAAAICGDAVACAGVEPWALAHHLPAHAQLAAGAAFSSACPQQARGSPWRLAGVRAAPTGEPPQPSPRLLAWPPCALHCSAAAPDSSFEDIDFQDFMDKEFSTIFGESDISDELSTSLDCVGSAAACVPVTLMAEYLAGRRAQPPLELIGVTELPTAGGVPVDLRRLFGAVMLRGGYQTVNRRRQWPEVAAALQLLHDPGANLHDVASSLRVHYMDYLCRFEEWPFCSQLDNLRDMADCGARKHARAAWQAPSGGAGASASRRTARCPSSMKWSAPAPAHTTSLPQRRVSRGPPRV